MRHLLVTAALVLMGLGCSVSAFAVDRALIVGIGNYQQENADLPGIDVDVEIMRSIAGKLGFDEVRVLRDDDATLSAIRASFNDFLNLAGEGDRVLFYFSGHGTQIPDVSGDESTDSFDEVLMTYDSLIIGEGASATLSVSLTDDELGELLRKVPSRNKIALIDACHSGTITKDLSAFNSLRGHDPAPRAKVFPINSALKGVRTSRSSPVEQSERGMVVLSAAGDEELAQATGAGSIFTLGIEDAFAGSSGQISPAELLAHTRNFVKQSISEPYFTPQISGDAELQEQPIRFASEQGESFWEQLLSIVDLSKPPLGLQPSQERFAIGELLTFSVDVPFDGYLNVINVDETDVPVVLFPNEWHEDNAVTAGAFELPSRETYAFPAQPPSGKQLVVAIVTEERINLRETAIGKRDGEGKMVEQLGELSIAGFVEIRRAMGGDDKNFAPRATERRPMAGKAVTEIY